MKRILLVIGALAPAIANAGSSLPASQTVNAVRSEPIALADGTALHVRLSRGDAASRGALVAVNNSGHKVRLRGFSDATLELADKGGSTIACTSWVPLRGFVEVLDRGSWSAHYVEAACGDVITLR